MNAQTWHPCPVLSAWPRAATSCCSLFIPLTSCFCHLHCHLLSPASAAGPLQPAPAAAWACPQRRGWYLMNPSFVLTLRLCGRVHPDLASVPDLAPCLPRPRALVLTSLPLCSGPWSCLCFLLVDWCGVAPGLGPPGRPSGAGLGVWPASLLSSGSLCLEGGCRGPGLGIGVVLCWPAVPLSPGGQPLLGVVLRVPLGHGLGPSGSLSLVSLSRSFPQLYCQTPFSCLLAGFMISFVISKMCFVFVSFVTSFTCFCVMAQGCGISSPVPGTLTLLSSEILLLLCLGARFLCA